MPEHPHITVYLEALEARVLGRPAEAIRLASRRGGGGVVEDGRR